MGAKAAGRWGRSDSPSAFTVACSVGIMGLCPLLAVMVYNAIHRGDGSLWHLLVDLGRGGAGGWKSLMPRASWEDSLLFGGWLLFQALLYVALPGPSAWGQETPAGHVLEYRVNGLLAWVISNGGLVVGSLVLGLFPLSIIADRWEGLLVAANAYGFLLTVVAFAKAHWGPTHPKDRKFTGSWLYDLFMGIELNPRLGDFFDFKLFHNGRPGIVAWTMINISFAAAQYRRFGVVSDSMVLVNVLQAIYVLDFFVHEDWYLKTIDIAHDHFGFYLSWGDSVWLPFMYTLQAQYLSRFPVQLGGLLFWTILAAGILGYCVFREANFQKDVCRRTDGKCSIWGRPASVLRTTYTSTDGRQHRSLLLISGFWGLARHCNYSGDLLLSAMMCAATGGRHLLPYFYIIFMAILLVHRVERDHARCLGKYGAYWEEYCRRVPYKLIPGLY